MTTKLTELTEEFRTVFAGRGGVADSIIPPALFLAINAWLNFEYAMWGSLLIALVITAIRLRRGQPLIYALGGFAGVALAILIAKLMGRAEGYFLPGIVTGGLTLLISGLSLTVGRPLVAWTSYIARRWPLDWYWHPKVRPAYSEVTAAWTIFFALRWLFQLRLFQDQATDLLIAANVVTGWPATIALLVVSYLYGTWRLRRLRGPSVEEFKRGAEPPWTGQHRGF